MHPTMMAPNTKEPGMNALPYLFHCSSRISISATASRMMSEIEIPGRTGAHRARIVSSRARMVGSSLNVMTSANRGGAAGRAFIVLRLVDMRLL